MSVRSNVIIHIQVNLIFPCSIPLYADCLLYSINSWYLGKVLYETTACWAQTHRGGSNTWLFPWPGFQLVQKKLKCNMALWKGGGKKSVAQLGWSFFLSANWGRGRKNTALWVTQPCLEAMNRSPVKLALSVPGRGAWNGLLWSARAQAHGGGRREGESVS